jgi:hypothetical protein
LNAEQSFLRALEIARSQGAQLFVLRTAASLGNLWLRLGKYSEAHVLLANAIRDMGEGLVLPDFAEVNTLLSQCSQMRPG